MIPFRRAFEEKRSLVIPVLAGLALNALLYAGVVYPLSVRVRSAEERARVADEQLTVADNDNRAARGLVEGRDRTDTALQAFYNNVLPRSQANARQISYLYLAQLADQHRLRYTRRSAAIDANPQGSLQRLRFAMSLEGGYEDVRRFIHQLEAGSDFVVIDSVAIAQGSAPNAPLELTLALSTYFRPDHGA